MAGVWSQFIECRMLVSKRRYASAHASDYVNRRETRHIFPWRLREQGKPLVTQRTQLLCLCSLRQQLQVKHITFVHFNCLLRKYVTFVCVGKISVKYIYIYRQKNIFQKHMFVIPFFQIFCSLRVLCCYYVNDIIKLISGTCRRGNILFFLAIPNVTTYYNSS